MKITTKNGHQFLFGPEAAASARWLLGSFRGDASARMFGRPTLGPFLFGKNNDLMWHFGSHGIDYADQLDEFVFEGEMIKFEDGGIDPQLFEGCLLAKWGDGYKFVVPSLQVP